MVLFESPWSRALVSRQIATVGPAASIINLVKDRGCWLRVERPEAAHVMVHPSHAAERDRATWRIAHHAVTLAGSPLSKRQSRLNRGRTCLCVGCLLERVGENFLERRVAAVLDQRADRVGRQTPVQRIKDSLLA